MTRPLVVLNGDIDLGRPDRFSASKVKTLIACPRLYWHTYMNKTERTERPRSKEGANFGTQAHNELQDLVTGQRSLIGRGKRVQTLAKAMYETQTFVRPRAELRFGLIYEELWFYGFIDVLDQGLILDWKTSIDPGLYRLGKRAFRTDPQYTIYGMVGLVLQSAPPMVRFVYGSSKDLTAGPIREHQSTERGLEQGMYTIRAMVSSLGTEQDEFERNKEHCSAYGGCPFFSSCWDIFDDF